jgi:hypothetical protein
MATLAPTQTPLTTLITTRVAPPSPTATPAARTLTVHNRAATVEGGLTKPCALNANLEHLGRGCEIISAVAAPGATVTYTIVYPTLEGRQLRQVFADTADYRGHSLHIFNVPYLPPAGARHGTARTVARVTVAATLADAGKTLLGPVSFRFTIVRPGIH